MSKIKDSKKEFNHELQSNIPLRIKLWRTDLNFKKQFICPVKVRDELTLICTYQVFNVHAHREN